MQAMTGMFSSRNVKKIDQQLDDATLTPFRWTVNDSSATADIDMTIQPCDPHDPT